MMPSDLRVKQSSCIGLERAAFESALLRKVVAALSTNEDELMSVDAELEIIRNLLTPGQRAVLLAVMVSGYVGNGGFAYFFSLPAADFFDIIVDEFLRLRAYEQIGLLNSARQIIEKYDEASLDYEHRQMLPAVLSRQDGEMIKELDNKYYDLKKKNLDLSALCRRYVQEHPDEFFVDAISPENVDRTV